MPASVLRQPQFPPIASPGAISVGILEDEAQVRAMFEQAVRADATLALAFSAPSVREAIEQARRAPAHVYLVDLGLPDADGRDFIRWLRLNQPQSLVMVVTVFGDDEHIVSSFESGAVGYLLKDATMQEITQRIHQLHAGGSPISPGVARRMLEHFMRQPAAVPNPLSEREHEVLRLIEKGLSYNEVAQVLGITWNTVTGYLRRVYAKLEVSSRGEAVFEARQRGLL